MPRFCRVLVPCATGPRADRGRRAKLAFGRIARAAPGTTARPWSTRTFSTVFAAVPNHDRVDAFGQILTCQELLLLSLSA